MAGESLPQDPRAREPTPPFPEQHQSPPGLEAAMRPRPDFGEQTYQGRGRLQGKAAIITGGDSGIGRAVAVAFAREGADVLISYLDEHEDARETVRVVEQAGRKAGAAAGDVSAEEHCRRLVQRAIETFGRLYILVNNAAFQKPRQRIGDIPSEEWDYTFRTNVYAAFWLCKAALPQLPAGGAIINTASVQADDPSASLLAYATTKGAIVTFTKALAREAIQRGVRVNAVAPGPVWTPLIASTSSAQTIPQFGASQPIGRPAQPAELAPAYVFLTSPEASYVVGTVLAVTGG